MFHLNQYRSDSHERVLSYQENVVLQQAWQTFHKEIVKAKYVYNFFWLDVPVLEYILAELRAYAPLVSVGSYCIVGDIGIEDTPDEAFTDHPWGKGNNPKMAVWEYMKENSNFEIDKTIDSKLILTASPDGYLKRKKINPT